MEGKQSETTLTSTTKTTLNPNANVFHCNIKCSSTGSSRAMPPDCNNIDNTTQDWTNHIAVSNVTGNVSPVVNGIDDSVAPITVLYPAPTPATITIDSASSPVTQHHHHHHHHAQRHQHDYDEMDGSEGPPSSGPTTTPSADPAAILMSANDDGVPLDEYIPTEQLRDVLRTQLEYYFSRENLANDTYLVSQMDADQYVPIPVVANFNQIKRLTRNSDLIVEALRESANVQVDDSGEKVRPMHKRCIVILREIPELTPIEEVEKLFSGENCPHFLSCQFAHNNSWYVVFDTEEDAQRAYRYLREEVRTFNGVPIMARIKAKPVHRSSSALLGKESLRHEYSGSIVYAQPKYTYTSQVPSIQYIPPQSMPFFTSSVSPVWSTNVAYYDPGMAFAANGYVPTATFTPSTVLLSPTQDSQPQQQQPQHNQQQQQQQGQSQGYQNSTPSTQSSTKQNLHSRRGRNTGYSGRSGGGNYRYSYDDYVQDDSCVPHNSDFGYRRNWSTIPGRASNDMYYDSRRSWYGYNGQSSPALPSPPKVEPKRGMSSGRGGSRGYGQRGGGGYGQGARRGGDGQLRSSVSSDQETHNRRSRAGSHIPGSHAECNATGKEWSNVRGDRGDRGGGSRGRAKNRSAVGNHSKMNGSIAKTVASFELEENCFPPLPGCTKSLTSAELFAPKISDIVRGTTIKSGSSNLASTDAERAMDASDSLSCPLLGNGLSITSQMSYSMTPTSAGKPSNKSTKSMDSLSQTGGSTGGAVCDIQKNISSSVQIKKRPNLKIANCSVLAKSNNLCSSVKARVVSSSSTASTDDDEPSDVAALRLSYAQMALRGKDRHDTTQRGCSSDSHTSLGSSSERLSLGKSQCERCKSGHQPSNCYGSARRERRTTVSSASLHSEDNDEDYESVETQRRALEGRKSATLSKSIQIRGKECRLKILKREVGEQQADISRQVAPDATNAD